MSTVNPFPKSRALFWRASWFLAGVLLSAACGHGGTGGKGDGSDTHLGPGDDLRGDNTDAGGDGSMSMGWTDSSISTQGNVTTVDLNGITWGSGQFVAVGADEGSVPAPVIYTSPDGTTWTSRTAPAFTSNFTLRGTLYSATASTFIVVGSGGSAGGIGDAPDGITFYEDAEVSTGLFTGLAQVGSSVLAFGSGAAMQSSDGESWTVLTNVVSGATMNAAAVATGTTNTVAVGYTGTGLGTGEGVVWASSSPTTNAAWTDKSDGQSVLRGVTYASNRFVAVGDQGALLVSPDGSTFSSASLGSNYQFYDIADCNGSWVIVGAGGASPKGVILTAPSNAAPPSDLSGWDVWTSATAENYTSVACSGTITVAVGEHGAVATRP